MKYRDHQDRRNSTFTLIELLVTIAIIGILASMLLPALIKARERARRGACTGNQKQLAVMVTMYADEYDGFLPAQSKPSGGSLFLGDIQDGVYQPMVTYLANEPELMACPSNAKLPRLVGSGTGNERWVSTILYLGGSYVGDDSNLSYFQDATDLPYYSPTKLNAEPTKAIWADTTFRAGDNRFREQPGEQFTAGNHGNSGYVEAPLSLHPKAMGVNGGNVTLIDGSIEFRSIGAMVPDPAAYAGYEGWNWEYDGPGIPSVAFGQGWSYTHDSSYGQLFF